MRFWEMEDRQLHITMLTLELSSPLAADTTDVDLVAMGRIPQRDRYRGVLVLDLLDDERL